MPQAWKWARDQFAFHVQRYTWCIFTCHPHEDATLLRNEVQQVNDLHIRSNKTFLCTVLKYLLHWGRPSQPGRCLHGDCFLGANTSTSASQCAGGISSGSVLPQPVTQGLMWALQHCKQKHKPWTSHFSSLWLGYKKNRKIFIVLQFLWIAPCSPSIYTTFFSTVILKQGGDHFLTELCGYYVTQRIATVTIFYMYQTTSKERYIHGFLYNCPTAELKRTL